MSHPQHLISYTSCLSALKAAVPQMHSQTEAAQSHTFGKYNAEDISLVVINITILNTKVAKTPSVSAGDILPSVTVVTQCNFSHMSTRTARRGSRSETRPGHGDVIHNQIIIVNKNARQ